MDYSDQSIGLSATEVDSSASTSANANSFASNTALVDRVVSDSTPEPVDAVDPELVNRRTSFLRLVPNTEQSTLPVVSVSTRSADSNAKAALAETPVLSLFGDVSDAEFPEVSANHPARSLRAHPSVPGAVSAAWMPALPALGTKPTLEIRAAQAALAKRNLASLSAQSLIPGTTDSALPVGTVTPTGNSASKQQAPARSRSFERRQPGSLGGVRATVGRCSFPATVSLDHEIVDHSTSGIVTPGHRATATASVRTAVQDHAKTGTKSFAGGRVSAKTGVRTAPEAPQFVIDLRDFESKKTVVGHRRTGGKEIESQNPASNYFDGHGYVQARATPQRTTQTQLSKQPSGQRRISLRARVVERTGLSSNVLTGLCLGAVGLFSVGVLVSPAMALHRIDIRRAGAAAPRIREAAQLRSGEPLISLDIEAIQRRVVALPEVSAAKVERKWPRGLRITVTTRTPVVVVTHAGRTSLVAADGTVLRDFGTGADVVDDGISYRPIATAMIAPVGQTVTGNSKRVVNLVAALTPDLRDRVVSVMVSGDDLDASFSSAERTGELTVRFGDEHELEIKAHALGALLGAGLAANVAAIDLTVPDAPVLRLAR